MDLKDTNRLGTYHISDDIQNYETARSNFFKVFIDGLDDLIYPQFSYDGSTENQDIYKVTGGSKRSGRDVIELSTNKMFVPHFSNGKIEVRRGNSVVNFADVPSFQSGTIELQDFVGLHTKDVLMAWQALVYDVNSDTQGRAGDWVDADGISHKGYKKNCILVEYTPDHQQIRYWELVGCWLSSITETPFEVDGQGGRQITCQLEYDRAYEFQPDDVWTKK